MYNYDYENFSKIGYEQALKYKIENDLPAETTCEVRSFAHDQDGSSLVEDVSVIFHVSMFVPLKHSNFSVCHSTRRIKSTLIDWGIIVVGPGLRQRCGSLEHSHGSVPWKIIGQRLLRDFRGQVWPQDQLRDRYNSVDHIWPSGSCRSLVLGFHRLEAG